MEQDSARRDEMQKLRDSTPLQPYRYYVPVGETAEYVIVDEEPTFFRYEHAVMNPSTNRRDMFLPCVREVADCPVCAAHPQDYPYFGMFLTVIDLSGYENSNGDWIEWTKKLLVVKPRQQKKFVRMMEREGSLRGAVVEARREGRMDAVIGNDFDIVEFMEEEELQTYEREYTNRKNDTVVEVGHEEYDYEALMPNLSLQALRDLVGGRAPAGNREETDKALGRGRGRAAPADTGGTEEEAAPARGRARPARGRTRPEAEAPEEDDHEDEAPTQSRARPARGRTQPEPQEDEDDAPSGRAPRGRRGAAAEEDTPRTTPPRGMRGRRAAPPEPPLEDDLDEDIPF